MSTPRSRAIADWILGIAGLGFGWASLLYPFGRDQGLYYYVAREWVLRGSVPYRDVLDHKTPGVYLLYALGVRLFGEVMWPIRLFDLGCVAAVGLLAAAIATPRDERIMPGLRGASILAISVLYFGYLDFWNTGQSELWYAMLGLGAVWAARRLERLPRADLLAGAFSGAAVFMKPPAVWLVVCAMALLTERHWQGPDGRAKRLALATARFGAGSLLLPFPVLAYFASKGAIGPMLDIVVGANNYYVKHETGLSSQLEVFVKVYEYLFVYAPLCLPFGVLVIRGFVQARRARNDKTSRSFAVAIALMVAAFLGVWMQKKFYLLHWTVILGPVCVAFAALLRSFQARSSSQARAQGMAFAAAATWLVLFAGSAYTAHGVDMWWNSTLAVARSIQGKSTRPEFSAAFASGSVEFWFDHSERVGDWLREHTTPDDFVTIRGFEPEIYAVAKRRHSGRFFWTTFIVNPQRAYRRAEWLAEDLRDLRAHPPKYVVTLTKIADGPDSTGYFVPLGYEVAEVMGEFTIMKRVGAS